MSRIFAPKCAMPHCNRPVSYSDNPETDGPQIYKWRAVCEQHRDIRLKSNKRRETDEFKTKRQCENRKGELGLGFVCQAGDDLPAVALDLDHKDSNHYNNDPDNIQVLCANCHRRKTLAHGDHLTRNPPNKPPMFDIFFTEE